MARIALFGDHSAHRSHRELDALRPVLSEKFGVHAIWVVTDSGADLAAFDGIWLVPGSPYADDSAAYRAVTVARTAGIPFLGTCGGMQYAVIEFARSVLGLPATHAESDGPGPGNAVTRLACSLYGEERMVTPVPGSRFARWCPEPFAGMHYCNYAPTPDVIRALAAAGVVVGATADDQGAEVLEFPAHRFFVTSMFQPQIGAMAGHRVHPLVVAFAAAASGSPAGSPPRCGCPPRQG